MLYNYKTIMNSFIIHVNILQTMDFGMIFVLVNPKMSCVQQNFIRKMLFSLKLKNHTINFVRFDDVLAR